MPGFARVPPCVVCDHTLSRKEVIALRDRKDIAVCRRCVERWRRDGAICPRCQAPVVGSQGRGIFLDRYVFGHSDCGASLLTA